MTFIGNLVKGLVALLMIGAVIAVGVFIFLSANINVHLNFGSAPTQAVSSQEPVMFTIQPGESVATIADNLQKEGIIDSTFWFRAQLKVKGAESSLKAGKFQLTPGMDTDTLIKTLSTPPLEVGVKFTVIEGTRIGEIADRLSKQGIVDKDKFVQMAGTAQGAAAYEDDFLKASGKPADQGLEGYLFPDTYEIKQNTGDNSDAVIRKMLGTMEQKFTPEVLKAISDRKLTVHQVLTVASIVQREGKVKAELPIIASVFWNRVNDGMQLDADPTTQYALGKSGDWWPQLNLDPNTVDNPYNTYKISGLPPGPIANPGSDAINAAASPAQTDYLYFVAKNDGSGTHAFAKTLAEHERNRVIYGNK